MLVLLGLLTNHFLGDFFCQTDWMALNKSSRWDALTLHVAVYSSMFVFPGLMTFGWRRGAVFVALVFVTHFLTDAVTSRVTSALWFFKREDGIWEQASFTQPKHGRTLVNPYTPIDDRRHLFFVAIGFDQLLHVWQLAAVWQLIHRL